MTLAIGSTASKTGGGVSTGLGAAHAPSVNAPAVRWPSSRRQGRPRCEKKHSRPTESGSAWQGNDFSLRDRGGDGCAQGVTAWPSFSGLPQGSRRLPACQTVLNAIGNLVADSRPVEEFFVSADIPGF